MKQKRIVAINDISCLGKCSLTVALPIISSLGIETVVLPTAMLSAHTAFEGFAFCDLTDQFGNIADHWKRLNESFDYIYSGYLGSEKQIELVSGFIDQFGRDDTTVMVDPVLGDNGRLYAGFTRDFAHKMVTLCKKADIITPNLTEASFILQREYVGFGYDEDYILDMLRALSELGVRKIALTGVSYEKDKVGVASYDAETGEYSYCENRRFESMFHGTGDVWASSFIAAYAKDHGFKRAVEIATEFTFDSIKATLDDKDEHWYGVKFENCLKDFADKYA